MSLLLIQLTLFISISLVVFYCLRGTADSVDNYSRSLSNSTESNLRRLFLVADTRKLQIIYFGTFIAVPLLLLLLKVTPLIIAACVVLLFVAPRLVFAQLNRKRRATINAALPDALAQISGAMRAGSTFGMSLQSYVNEVEGPLSQEFSLLQREQRLGARLEDALENLGERVQSEEVDLLVSAALIANDVGGNLAEILQSLAETIRRKIEMEGKIDALTAQGRLQGRVVSALPFLILLPLIYFEPAATLPLFTSLLGWVFLVVIIGMDLIGSILIQKIVSIDI
ncbi:type II secretion system F family protein [Granulosicoccus sp.]|nr:type II secretion system F family protein [Granulosicoccus sp.]MDB4222398.1 type II secretion system F family protein [Granulosicoccus sp.]